ncbi:MAG: DUF2905 domain-containing protein [bacterium]
MSMQFFGKTLILFGILFVIIGAFLLFFERIPYLGKLPGDIFIRRGNTVIFFPIVTCLLLSVILSIILNLLRR